MPAPASEPFTVGVEEEFQLVDAETRELRPRAEAVLDAASRLGGSVQPELNLSQIEIDTPICDSLDEVADHLRRLRADVMGAAVTTGSRIAAVGTHPFTHWLGQSITPKERYLGLDEDYQQLAREQLVCGCHVHVCVNDREIAIRIMDRLRPWLAPLLALGANSPYWLGVDTGYASYRTQLFDRWPLTGTPLIFGSRGAYDDLVDALVATESLEDASKIYFDVRPSMHYETLEFRVFDVCMTVDEAVLMAGLSRALVRTCYDEVVRDAPLVPFRPELLRAARWRAARYGLGGSLIDVWNQRAAPAAEVIGHLLAFLRPDLLEHGEWTRISGLAERVLRDGNGAHRQREAMVDGDLRSVVDLAIRATASAHTGRGADVSAAPGSGTS